MKILKLSEIRANHLLAWRKNAYEDFNKILNNEDFPCIFALRAFKNKTAFIAFVNRNDKMNFVNILKQYTQFCKKTPLKQRILNPLLVFFEEQFSSIEEEQNFAWEQIQFLHNQDEKAFLAHIPKDINHPQWTFCFNEVEIFFNVSCPHHKILKNRNLGEFITFVINPRENFDYVAPNDFKGIKIRQTIRTRVENYNQGIFPSELGFFGDEHSLEYKQYCLKEPHSKIPMKCPLKLNIKV